MSIAPSVRRPRSIISARWPSEVRVAIRRLIKEPALTIAAILTLALGIGACTAMFSIVEAVLLKSMDIAQPQRLVVMWPQFGDTAGEFTYNAYLELSRQSATFERVALSGSANWPVPVDILLPDGAPHARDAVRRIRHVLRCARRAAASRTDLSFRRGSSRRAARDRRQRRILENEARWRSGRRRSNADDRPRRAGESSASCRRSSSIRPAPTSGRPPRHSSALTSDDKSPAALAKVFNKVGAFHVLARLKPGVSASQAAPRGCDASWLPRSETRRHASRSRPLLEHVFGSARRALWLLMGAVGLVLVIACANVAGLLRRAQRAPRARACRAARAGRDGMAAVWQTPSSRPACLPRPAASSAWRSRSRLFAG